jgi:hypothetical protein
LNQQTEIVVEIVDEAENWGRILCDFVALQERTILLEYNVTKMEVPIARHDAEQPYFGIGGWC